MKFKNIEKAIPILVKHQALLKADLFLAKIQQEIRPDFECPKNPTMNIRLGPEAMGGENSYHFENFPVNEKFLRALVDLMQNHLWDEAKTVTDQIHHL